MKLQFFRVHRLHLQYFLYDLGLDNSPITSLYATESDAAFKVLTQQWYNLNSKTSVALDKIHR